MANQSTPVGWLVGAPDLFPDRCGRATRIRYFIQHWSIMTFNTHIQLRFACVTNQPINPGWLVGWLVLPTCFPKGVEEPPGLVSLRTTFFLVFSCSQETSVHSLLSQDENPKRLFYLFPTSTLFLFFVPRRHLCIRLSEGQNPKRLVYLFPTSTTLFSCFLLFLYRRHR